MKVLCFVPVFNEILEFPRLLDRLRQQPRAFDELLLIDNGSSDGCEKLIAESEFPSVRVEPNRGVGFAIRTACEWGLEHGFDVLTGLAANGKMLPDELPRLLTPILEGRSDYVTGSRYLAGGGLPNLPLFRQATIPMVNLFAWLASGVRVSDATCGYRAYRLELLRRAAFDWHAAWLETYGFEYYLFAKVLRDRSIRWCEVPVTMRYPARKHSYSKIRPGQDWWAMLKPWLVARVDGKGFRPN